MSAAAVVTMIGLALLALVLAGYLAVVAWTLYRVNVALGSVLDEVRAVTESLGSFEPTLVGIRDDVAAILDVLPGANPSWATARR